MKALTVRQPHASLIVAGLKPVENRTWPVPSTVPQWWECAFCCLPTRRHHRYDHETRYHYHQGTRFEVTGHDDPFPFRLAIHAAQKIDWNAMGKVPHVRPDEMWWGEYADLPTGVLLGYVTVTGCHRACDCELDLSKWGYRCANPLCSPWAEPEPQRGTTWHWTLADPVALDEPVPWRGRQGLWDVPDDVLSSQVPS